MIRIGFATNSSSTHSMIIHESEFTDDYDHCGFDSRNFALCSAKLKKLYLSYIFYTSFESSVGPEIAALVCDKALGIKGDFNSNQIDHQSMIYLPKQYGMEVPDLKFMEELKEYVLHQKLAIIQYGGYNDYHRLFEFPTHEAHTVCRKDGDYWTLFNKEDGLKVRFKMVPGEEITLQKQGTKLTRPELVDLKITDYCDRGCKYCYQDSSTKGKHAEFHRIQDIIDVLAELQVFEIAIGGGEPTSHPQFTEIIKYARSKGITPNFSTRNKDILNDSIVESVGAVGFSVDNFEEYAAVNNAVELLNSAKFNIYNRSLVIHIIPEIIPEEDLKRIAKSCHQPILLLGYKYKGRADAMKPKRIDWDAIWEDTFRHCWNLSVDTCFAETYEDFLVKCNISNHLYQTKEGLESCYIDAVEGTIARSSFDDEQIHVDNWTKDKVTEEFAKF